MENTVNQVKILLVEDSVNDAELTLRALKKNKLTNSILHLRDGEEALDYLFGQGTYEGRNTLTQPKLVLLDLKMPKVSGLEVLKQMRENEVTKKIPVVMLTSSKEERDMIESYELGVNSYIVKPVDFDDFTKAVKDIGFYWLLLNQLPNT